MTNVYELYQGLTPIKIVYRDDKIVWKPPVFLYPHLAYLDLDKQINVIDSSVVAKAIIADRILTEYYTSRRILGAGNALPLYLLKGNFVDKYATHVSGNGLSLNLGSLTMTSTEFAATSDELHALTAHGKVYDHLKKINVLVEMVEHALAFNGILTSHYLAHDLMSESVLSAMIADAELFKYADAHGVSVDHFSIAQTTASELSSHIYDNALSVSHYNNGISADTVQCEHETTLMADDDCCSNALPAPSKQGISDSISDVYHDQSAYLVDGLSANSTTYESDEVFEYTDNSDLSTLPIQSVALTDIGGVCTEELNVSDGYADCVNEDIMIGISVVHSHMPDTMIWVFPEQAVSELYIPGLYDDGVFVNAVQNGAELAL